MLKRRVMPEPRADGRGRLAVPVLGRDARAMAVLAH